MIKINISSLEFEDIKSNIKEYFKKDKKYTDYNFEGSALSSLLNILAYNTHYSGYYIKMILNEAFSDTAQTREAQISHAKRLGYVVKGKTSAYANVRVKVNGVDPSVKFITIPAGTTFNSTSTSDIRNVFHTINDYTIKRNSKNEYILDNVIIQQGNIVKDLFRVNEDNQKFKINDPNCDVSTIKVYVKTSETTTVREQYNQVVDVIDIEDDSKVWYVNMASSGLYSVYFGQDRFGRQPQIGEYVDIEYVSTNGTLGNNVNRFTISPKSSQYNSNIGFYSEIEVTTVEPSQGGVDEESVEDLRFAIPNHNKRQKRVVNENDYKSVLINEFRDVESITVWGGEKNSERYYAKMFISVKPYNSDNLSETAKTLIRNNMVKRYGIVGSNVVFVKPEYINLDLTIYVKLSKLAAIDKQQVESDITIKAENYNKNILTKFDAIYSDTDFINNLRDDIDYISSVYTRKVINKKIEFTKGKGTRYHIQVGNSISDFKSSVFDYGLSKGYLNNEGNQIYVYDEETNKRLSELSIGSVDFNSGVAYVDIPRDLYGDSINVICTPSNPDIETYLNNIVRFSNINVEVV